nr:prolyl oligopeptidase family serine peptidase [Caulobacter sp. 17J65-9]
MAGCGPKAPEAEVSLAEARSGLVARAEAEHAPGAPAPVPPAEIFSLVRYPAQPGLLSAYVTPSPGDGARHPAIIWITGGDSNTIDDLWHEADPSNDQTAAAYRKAGIVMMFPSLRGGNDNPGRREGFYGEVDDVLAAADYLSKLDYVDPNRIYLGGHSTGGTLVLLTAEYSDRFRAVFSFGPTDDVAGYGGAYLPGGLTAADMRLRSPIYWTASIRSPVFVFEGDGQGNASAVTALQAASRGDLARFYLVKGGDHFSVLAPTNALIAAKVLADTGPQTNLSFTQDELDKPFASAG